MVKTARSYADSLEAGYLQLVASARLPFVRDYYAQSQTSRGVDAGVARADVTHQPAYSTR